MIMFPDGLMPTPPLPTAIALMILHCMIGTVAAWVAYRQGRPLRAWLGWGLLGGTLALVVVLVTAPPAPPTS